MNKSTKRTRALVRQAPAAAVAVVALWVLSGCGNAIPNTDSGSLTPAGTSSSAAAGVNEADVQFAQRMSPHLDQAVQMSTLLLAKKGVNAEVSVLAKQIKATEEPHIATFDRWLTAWGRPFGSSNGNETDSQSAANHHAGNGLMTPLEMQDLDMADADTGQKLFLEGMIRHHQGAVEMAEAEIKDGMHPDAVQLARKLVTDHHAEITTLQDLLSKL